MFQASRGGASVFLIHRYVPGSPHSPSQERNRKKGFLGEESDREIEVRQQSRRVKVAGMITAEARPPEPGDKIGF